MAFGSTKSKLLAIISHKQSSMAGVTRRRAEVTLFNPHGSFFAVLLSDTSVQEEECFGAVDGLISKLGGQQFGDGRRTNKANFGEHCEFWAGIPQSSERRHTALTSAIETTSLLCEYTGANPKTIMRAENPSLSVSSVSGNCFLKDSADFDDTPKFGTVGICRVTKNVAA
eukprot:scaffold2322_cov135-Cylindrotheca_fusiformis.AAC.1